MSNKFDGLFSMDSAGGKKALIKLQAIQPGDVFEDSLMPALDLPLVWECVAAGDKEYLFEGTYAGIPFYNVAVSILEKSIGIKKTECN